MRQPKGEIVLLIGGAGTEHSREGASQDSETGIANKGAGIEQEIKLGQAAGGVGREELAELLHGLLEGGMSVSGAVKEVVTNLSVNKKVAYGLALEVSRRLPKGDD